MALTIEEFKQNILDMSDSELTELISTIRKDRTTITTDKIKRVRRQAKKKDIKSIFDGLSEEELELVKIKLKGG